MKHLLVILTFLSLMSSSYSQDEDMDLAPGPEDQAVIEEAYARYGEPNGLEIEKQEEMLHPEGEQDWSLGSEDLASEEYE